MKLVVPEVSLQEPASEKAVAASAPVAVGGLGGSGTRVVAQILREAGIAIGGDLNDSLDNLWFTLLFKHRGILQMPDDRFRRLVAIFVAAMSGGGCPTTSPDPAMVDELAAQDRIQHDSKWLRARAESLRRALAKPVGTSRWGWKEPNTHMVVDRLAAELPGMKYIHVARNGLDMAYSSNQNQLQLWGPAVLGADHAMTPRNALRFWCWAHARIVGIGERMKPRFLFVRLEDLCAVPEAEIRKILTFAGVKVDAMLLDRAAKHVVPPKSIGRYRTHSAEVFDPGDVAFARKLGFEV